MQFPQISVGSPLYTIDCDAKPSGATAAVSDPSTPPTSDAPVGTPGAKVTVRVPVMGESITTGVLAKWLCKVGDGVTVDQVLASIETDKVTVDVRSPHEGVVSQLFSAEGQEVNVDEDLLEIQPQPVAAKQLGTPAAPKTAPSAPTAAVPEKATTLKVTTKEAASPAAKPTVASSEVGANRTETRVKMTRMRLRIAQRLKDSQNTAAMLTTFQEVDMTNLIDLRNRYKEDFEKVHGVKLGFMSAFVRVCSARLKMSCLILG